MKTIELPAIVTELFDATAKEGCIIALLRPRFEGESIYDGDLDLTINPAHCDLFLQLAWRYLTSNGIDFSVIRVRQEKIRLEIFDPLIEKNIVLELWSCLQVRKSSGFASLILWEDLSGFVCTDDTSLTGYRLHPDVEICYYLSHLLTKNKSITTPLVQKRINYYRELPGVSSEVLSLISQITTQDTLSLVGNAANARLHTLGVLKRSSLKETLRRLPSKISNLAFRLNLARSKASAFLAFVGPDGVGKTTIIKSFSLISTQKSYYFKFKNSFRKSLFYRPLHLLYRGLLALNRKEALLKNQIDERLALVLFLISALKMRIRSMLNILTKRVALADRSFSDFYISGARFPDMELDFNKTTYSLSWIAPPPRIIIHLNAPADVIHQRKQELSTSQIDAYQRLTLLAYLKNPTEIYLSINTDKPIEKCMSSLKALCND